MPGEITSARAAAVVAAVRLGKRAFRTRDRRFLAEGPQAVREALACPGTVGALFVTAEAEARHPDLMAAADVVGPAVHRVSGPVMEALAQTTTPQGIVAVCGFVDVGLPAALDAAPRLSVLLAQVRDPGNAGTVIRVADAAGAGAVLLSHGSVDVYNAKCVRAGAGSMFHLPITVEVDTVRTVAALRQSGMRVLAADGRGRLDLDDLADSGGLAAPTTWIFGNEAWGLPAEVAELADDVVRVPIHGRAESLNLATAAAVCLYASARAHRRGD
jgi:TrmH family RNA methyltransferase